MKLLKYIVFGIFLMPFAVFSQQRVIDSLQAVLKTEKEDTNKVITLNILSEKLWRKSIYDTSLIVAKSAQALAENLTFKKGVAVALRNVAIILWYQGKYPEALECQQKALAINREIGNNSGIAANLSNIGTIYKDQGDYVKALDYYLQGLNLDKESKDENRISSDLGNIGIIYHVQGDYPKSLDYYLQALKISEKHDDKYLMAHQLNNIGNIYNDEKEYSNALDYYLQALKIDKEIGAKIDMAVDLSNIGNFYNNQNNFNKTLEYYEQSLKLCEELGNTQLEATTFGNIGNIYSKLKDYKKALAYYDKALNADEELGNKNGLGADLGNIGSLYTTIGNFKDAEPFLKRAIKVDDSIGALSDLMQNEISLSQLYDTTKQYKLALYFYRKAIVINDSLFNKDKNNALTRKEMNYQFEKKADSTKAEQSKKDLMSATDKKKQQFIIWSVCGGLLLVLIFAGFILRSLRITRKQKDIIEVKSKETEEQKKNILDSITYAKRLQDAILPPLSIIKKYLPESFLLYKPKDIVAGDFYWMEQTGDTILIAAADCTGHGVPGAMVSVVCSNALNRTVKEFKITEPGRILDKVRELVLETFEKSESEVQDGMDISLCCLNIQTKEIQWSGANNPLWYIQNSELKEVAPDKQPIGKFNLAMPFNTTSLKLQKGDTLYLFTDGYADQFGGPSGKKFKYKQLQEKLLAMKSMPMNKQKDMLDETIESWKGSLEQVDDILIMGIRV